MPEPATLIPPPRAGGAEAVRRRVAESVEPGLAEVASSAFQRDVEGGAAPEQAGERLRRLDEALHSRIRPFEWQQRPVYEAWRDLFAGGPGAEAGLALLEDLAGRKILGEDAALLARAVAAPVAGLPLERRAALLERLLDGLGSQAEEGGRVAWSMLQARLEDGKDPDRAAAEASRQVQSLLEAMGRAGLRGEARQRPLLEACGMHLSALPALLPAWPVRLLEAGVRLEAVEAVAEAARTLGPLLARGGPDVAREVARAMEPPLRRPWRVELAALGETLSLLLGPGDPLGIIAEEGPQVIIGDVRLPRRDA